MRGHNICFMQNKQKLSLLIIKYSLLSRALDSVRGHENGLYFANFDFANLSIPEFLVDTVPVNVMNSSLTRLSNGKLLGVI